MSQKRQKTARSVHQRVGNAARERGLDRDDALVAYAIDRFLYRLGRSSQAKEFAVKGGVLVANLVEEPFRFSRDLDTLRRRGPPDPDDVRRRLTRVAALQLDDGLTFGKVRAVVADRATDGYDGVKVNIEAMVEGQTPQGHPRRGCSLRSPRLRREPRGVRAGNLRAARDPRRPAGAR